jgi:hypothetical protein
MPDNRPAVLNAGMMAASISSVFADDKNVKDRYFIPCLLRI